MPESGFSLHPRLAADTHPLCQLGFSDLLLMDDSRFPWLILVPRFKDASEWFDLPDEMQIKLSSEVSDIAKKLKHGTGADKINIAALGNQVPQLHIHIIARFKSDAAWPNPVWGNGKAIPYTAETLEKMRKILNFGNITNL